MHRRVAAPGFNEGVFGLVWEVTMQLFWEMGRGEGWEGLRGGERVEVRDVSGLMLRVSAMPCLLIRWIGLTF